MAAGGGTSVGGACFPGGMGADGGVREVADGSGGVGDVEDGDEFDLEGKGRAAAVAVAVCLGYSYLCICTFIESCVFFLASIFLKRHI
ncbi:unnamed protein product [Vitrella brassicaformis CCMP3155]|uniref:Uncharacterized protein n=1 Tax=Vitrella brassicaformis (strain CCMP3155) TaxID=1169540 RepID=A0A0G4H385_VITBC|nr:unnamed protein product [Vitrella brassicaformis CCMP3155]|eukprot:CEM38178.1 unnamed protein product [Vitrella brassicaformis CCMP3155]